MSKPSDYELCGQLKGAKGAVNALVFSTDAKLLFSGGDDGCLRIWNTDTLNCEQALRNEKWGQITALTYLHVEPPLEERGASICVGTGRGSLFFYPRSKNSAWFIPKEVKTVVPFAFNDPVESQVYDALNRRLGVASHSGQVKLYDVRKCVDITLIWTASMETAIPRSLAFFGGANQSLLVHGLESGEMTCRSAQTAEVLWSKTLAGGIGNAALSPDETLLLVDNLSTGNFDVYSFPASTPSSSFSLPSTRRFPKQCVFGEAGKVAVCGSDHGKVHVMNIATSECMQSLQVSQDSELIQVVATASTDGDGHLIAGGSSAVVPAICLWRKQPPKVIPSTPSNPAPPLIPFGLTKQAYINIFFGVLIALMSYPNWASHLQKTVGKPISKGWQDVVGSQAFQTDNPFRAAEAREAAVMDIPATSSRKDISGVVVPTVSESVSGVMPAITVTVTVSAPAVLGGMAMAAATDSVDLTVAFEKKQANTPSVDIPV